MELNQNPKLKGVSSRRSGKYTSEILDPITKKRMWLGTFLTPEEASMAYSTKRREFDQKVLENKRGLKHCSSSSGSSSVLRDDNRQTSSESIGNNDEISSDIPELNNGFRQIPKLKGVSSRRSGKYTSEILDPVTKKRVWLGTFLTPEGASSAYNTKRREFDLKVLENKRGLKNCSSSVLRDDNRQTSSESIGNNDGISSDIPENHTTELNNGFRQIPKLQGVSSRRSGKYTSEILDPITKKRVWLGTFLTLEEASMAYSTKRREFDQKVLENKRELKNCSSSSSSSSVLRDDNRQTSSESMGNDEVFSFDIPENQTIELNNGFRQIPELKGVSRRRSGKYTSEILEPITKKRLWLGTFLTPEEASMAYNTKRREFDLKVLEAKRGIKNCSSSSSPLSVLRDDNRQSSSESIGKNEEINEETSFDIPENQTIELNNGFRQIPKLKGVSRRRSGKYTSEILDPVTKKRLWLGTFLTPKEASMAYNTKRCEFDQKVLETKRRIKTSSSSPSSVRRVDNHQISSELIGKIEEINDKVAVINDDDDVRFGYFDGVQIVDKDGFFVGEFSKIDDLSICSMDDDEQE